MAQQQEKLVRSADASCYNFVNNAWECLDGGLSTVWLFRANDNSSARIVAKSTSNQQYVVNSALSGASTASMVSSNFVQWSSGGLLWGLNFADADNASYFCKRILQVIDLVKGTNAGAAGAAAVVDGGTSTAPEPQAQEPTAANLKAQLRSADDSAAAKPVTASSAAAAMAAVFSKSLEPSAEDNESLTAEDSVTENSEGGEVSTTNESDTATPSESPVSTHKGIAVSQSMPNFTRRGSTGSGTDSAALGKGVSLGTKRSSVISASGDRSGSNSNRNSAQLTPGSSSPPSQLLQPQAVSEARVSGPDVTRVATSDSASNSPKMPARGRFSTTSSVRGSALGSRRGTATGEKPPLTASASGSIMGSPSTLRSFKKKGNWKDQVDMSTPRSLIISNLEVGVPEETSLMRKDMAALSTRERVIKELFTTEKSYCKALQQVVKIAIPLATHKVVFKPDVQSQIFGNIDFIYAVNTSLLSKLHQAISTWNDATSTVGDILLNSIKSFKPYGKYLAEYSSGLKLLEELEQKKKPVQAYCSSCQEECGGLTLASLLVTPVQRIPRYILLLKEIIKFTGEDHPDRENLIAALEAVQKYAEDMNKTVKLSENKKEFTRLCGIVEGMANIKSPLLFSDESVRVTADSNLMTWMVLFSDRLVLIKDKAIGQEVMLQHIWCKNITSKTNDLVLQLLTPSQRVMIEFEIPQNKHQWIERIESAIQADGDEGKYLVNPGDIADRTFAFKWSQKDNTVSIYQGMWRDAVPHGIGKYKYGTKASYEGSFFNGKRQGMGKMLYPSGACLECEWKDGLPCGTGKLVSAAAEYDGDFADGEFTGQGKLTHADGSVYEGGFLKGYYHGKGVLRDAAGTTYDGEFKNGLRHGFGKLIGHMGKYEGNWQDDRQSDENGTMTFASGDIYKGSFIDGLPSGKGSLEKQDGSHYVGMFSAGMFHGEGVLTEHGGSTVYAGHFVEGRPEGQGKRTYPDGSVYEGEWLAGRRHGQGVYTFHQKFCYDGAWEAGHFHGRGKLKDIASGRVLYDGHWKCGRREGKGYSTYEDGTKYTGGFVNDLRDGVGVLENVQAQWKYGGDWVRGRRHGQGELIAPNYRYEGSWENDRRTGKGKERFIDSALSFEGTFLNDRRVKGKMSVEQQGKIPIHAEVDYELYGTTLASEAVIKLPPPLVGISFQLFECEVFTNY